MRNFLFILLILQSFYLKAVEVSEALPFQYTMKTKMKYGGFHFHTKIEKYYPKETLPKNDPQFSNSKLKFRTFESQYEFGGFEIIIKNTAGLPIVGLGTQYSKLLLNGSKPFVFTEEQGIGRGDKPLSNITKLIGISGNEFSSYCPIPIFYVGTQNAFVIEDVEYAEFDFTLENEIRIKVFDSRFHFLHVKGRDLKELISVISERYGRMYKFPDWAFGTCLGIQGGSKKVETILEQARKYNNPITSVWIQDWVGKRKTRLGSQLNWQWISDSLSYPQIKNWISKLNLKGIKVLGYVNPFLSIEGPLTQEAKTKNYLVKNKKGEVYKIETGGFPAYMIDLTNPNAVIWLKEIILNNMIRLGFSGWMADFGEWLPLDAVLHNGLKGIEYHNQYTVDWARLNNEIISENNQQDSFLFFNRSGSLYTSKWSSLMWCGDQMVNDQKHDGMPSAINALITSGISGIQLNHSDIGGYAGVNNIFLKLKRNESLLRRWIEWSAFTPFYRTHEGLLPENFAQVYSNDSLAKHFAKFGIIHLKLKPYIQQLLNESKEFGYPLIRPLFFHFPDEKECYKQEYTFLLGDELLVIPHIQLEGQNEFYLPTGIWIDLQTGVEISGGIKLERNSFRVYAKKGGKNESLFKTLFNHG